MHGDSYPREVVVLVYQISTFFATILGSHLFSRCLRPYFSSDWETKVSMVQSFEKKIQEDCCLLYMHEVYKNIIHRCLDDLKRSQEAQNIWETELPGDSIERTLKIDGNSIERIQEFQEELYYDSYE